MTKTMTKPITILIVDDAHDMRRTICDILSLEPGFEVIGQAVNGIEGMELALELEPDVIIMNNSMPEMSGLEATDKIKRVMPDTCVIMLSSHTEISYRYMAAAVGVYAYIVTPLMDFDLLYSVIREGVVAHQSGDVQYAE